MADVYHYPADAVVTLYNERTDEAQTRTAWLVEYLDRFLQETGLTVSDLWLVEERSGTKTRWSFERKPRS